MSDEIRYKEIKDLPDWMRNTLPKEALQLYLEGYKRGWELYDPETQSNTQQREETAHREGWNAMTSEFVQDEQTGAWHHRGEEVQEEEAHKSLIDRIRDLF